MQVRIEVRAPSSTQMAREIVAGPNTPTIALGDEKFLDNQTKIKLVDWRLYDAVGIPERVVFIVE